MSLLEFDIKSYMSVTLHLQFKLQHRFTETTINQPAHLCFQNCITSILGIFSSPAVCMMSSGTQGKSDSAQVMRIGNFQSPCLMFSKTPKSVGMQVHKSWHSKSMGVSAPAILGSVSSFSRVNSQSAVFYYMSMNGHGTLAMWFCASLKNAWASRYVHSCSRGATHL